jgi:CheY-like chemotaxis protein
MEHGLTVQSGGGMHIASEVGRGTMVTLWLPRARPEDVAPAPVLPLAPSSASAKLRILLVDDDSLVSMNTAYMLMDLGHSVMESPSGSHALKLLESDAQFDVMLTDYAMPEMTGLELATKVRNIKRDCRSCSPPAMPSCRRIPRWRSRDSANPTRRTICPKHWIRRSGTPPRPKSMGQANRITIVEVTADLLAHSRSDNRLPPSPLLCPGFYRSRKAFMI